MNYLFIFVFYYKKFLNNSYFEIQKKYIVNHGDINITVLRGKYYKIFKHIKERKVFFESWEI